MKVSKLVSKGFSLVEMLVVIAIIGVIAAIAVPQISDFTGAANTNKDKRNAQNLSSVCAAAQAAGYDFTKTDGTGADLEIAAVVAALADGATIPEDSGGSFAGQTFAVPNMEAGDQVDALAYLELGGVAGKRTLNYVPAGPEVPEE